LGGGGQKWSCVDGWFNDDIARYFLFMAVVLPLITLIGSCTVRVF
jgi:hypothetical protein